MTTAHPLGATLRRMLLIAACGLLVAGCGESHGDLRAWIDQVKAGPKPKVEALPQMPRYEKFTYQAAHLRDPFADVLRRVPVSPAPAAVESGPRPDASRPREPLEGFPLDALRMVGTLARDGSTYALVRAPDRTVTRISVGDRLGQNHGKVQHIGDAEIHLVELVETSQGNWVEREAALVLAEQQ